MKLVKEHMNEAFTDSTDPVKDMHVGGIDLGKAWKETVVKGINEWFNYLRNLQLIGKTVTATLSKVGTEKTVKITNIKKGLPNEIYIYYEYEGDTHYFMLDCTKKIYIHDD